MGGLFSIFNSNELKDFELLWTHDNIPENDAKVFEDGQVLAEKCFRVKKSLEDYNGCKDVIKSAMESKQGTEENRQATRRAMEMVAPNAALCAEWYDCAVEVGNFFKDRVFPILAKHVDVEQKESDNKEEKKSEEPTDLSEKGILLHHALIRQICELFDFLLAFDQLKMLKSQVQNGMLYLGWEEGDIPILEILYR
ncbi:hypothetical protein RFI_14274, partial [Reticulomyxa filosa]